MGLKGYGSWVNLIQRAEPHRGTALRRSDDGVAANGAVLSYNGWNAGNTSV